MVFEEPFLQLAPTELPGYRVRRYHGDDLCLSLQAFHPTDRGRIQTLYTWLQGLMAALSPYTRGRNPEQAAEFLHTHPPEELGQLVQQLGRDSSGEEPNPLLARTVHDIRGGGLTPLLGQVQLAAFGPMDAQDVEALYFLTRDHLKIMRNALLGLDDAKRQEDLLPKVHGTEFIVEKWNGAVLHGQERDVRLEVDCRRHTAISECCVEFGALDRILYNLINNACRHSASDRIRLVLFPVPEPEGINLRFVLLNEVREEDLGYLRSVDLKGLFAERASTTGSGYGLAIATEFVSHAYGLTTPEQALAGGYLGATLLDGQFAAWFHWPRVVED